MKILLVLVYVFPLLTFGQEHLVNNLKFEQGFHECLNNWVVYPPSGKEYFYGYVYVEPNGFRSLHPGTFKLKKGEIKEKPYEGNLIITTEIRIDYGSGPMTLMPSELREFLNLPKVPEQLEVALNSIDSVDQLVLRGYHFNHMGLSKFAIHPLEEAYKFRPESNDLLFELSYALNSNKRYEEALEILRTATQNDSSSALLFRELGYTYLKLNQLDSAEQTYRQGLQVSTENSEKSEMAINMAQAYFTIKNRTKFEEWAALTREYAEPNSTFLDYLKEFEKELNE